jgi:hypothetical protein
MFPKEESKQNRQYTYKMLLWGVGVIIFCILNATVILGVIESRVTVNYVKISSAAQQCRCGEFMSPATM